MTTAKALAHGYQTEELLRQHFLRLGFYVIRGAAVKIGTSDATDVDLWLYSRSSAVGRERICVDVKDKQRAKATERFFWAKGLQGVLGLDRCIVATTDKRPEVRQFATQHGILLLDGKFLSELQNAGLSPERLSDEDLELQCFGKSHGRLFDTEKVRLRRLKALVLTDLDFDGCNEALAEVTHFVEKSMVAPLLQHAALRMIYLSVSIFLICTDHATRRVAFEEPDRLGYFLADGFRYGSRGAERFDEAFAVALSLVDGFDRELRPRVSEMRSKAREALVRSVPTEILADHFGRSENHRDLFLLARQFEQAAYSTSLPMPHSLSAGCQSVLGVLLDFLGIERNTLFGIT